MVAIIFVRTNAASIDFLAAYLIENDSDDLFFIPNTSC